LSGASIARPSVRCAAICARVRTVTAFGCQALGCRSWVLRDEARAPITQILSPGTHRCDLDTNLEIRYAAGWPGGG